MDENTTHVLSTLDCHVTKSCDVSSGLVNSTSFPALANTTFETKVITEMYVTDSAKLFRKVVNDLDVYVVPLIILFGVAGNMASLLVFLSRSLRQQSWSIYLASLAVSDTGFLVCLFFSWSNNIGVSVYHRQVWCQSLVYLTYVCSFLSVWYIVCFTVERYIVVKIPLKRIQICTAKRARIVVVSLASFALLFYSFATWTSDLQPMYGHQAFCMPKTKYVEMLRILSYVDTTITLVIPIIVIVILNALIIYKVTVYQKQRNTMTGVEAVPLQSRTSHHSSLNKQQPQQKQQQNNNKISTITTSSSTNRSVAHMNRMLVIVSSTFVVLNMPAHTIRMYTFFMNLVNSRYMPSHELVSLQKLFQYVYYINFSINFVLYSACGTQFRSAMAQICKRTLSSRSSNKRSLRIQEETTRNGSIVSKTNDSRLYQ